MLSKSQARLFFLIGTVGFSLLFLFLTVDTMRQVPKQTNQDQITEAVIRGKRIWEHNYCTGCHTIFGEGAYYAPELTKVLDRRGEPWVRTFLKDPQAMFPGERKMTNYHFSDQQIDDLIAYFDWIGKVDLNGFPPEPVNALAQAAGSRSG
ncbi:MAG TPA: cytochrome c, partial [Trueperaceae bacterium]|nr:cytochrome c [Trueperaceae bacterium]